MHRKHRMSRTAFPILMLSLFLGGVAPWAAPAGDDFTLPPRRDGELVVQQPPVPAAKSAQPGAGVKSVVISIGSTQRLEMKNKKEIEKAINTKPNIAEAAPIPGDDRAINLTGKESGVTRVTLKGRDGTEEVFDVTVQFDIEFLRTLLVRAVPTASLNLIPAASGAVIIGGTVQQAEDIDIILRAANSVLTGGDRVINAMRVGGVQQVQLDVVVAFVSRTELRRMSFDFLLLQPSATVAGLTGQGLSLSNGMAPTFGASGLTTGFPNGAPPNFFLAVTGDRTQFFGFLQALRDERLAKILAQPKLVTLSGRSATLLSGGEQAIPEAAGLGSISVRFEPFGTKLNFLPIVLGDGKIHLEVEPEVSNIDPSVGTSISGTTVPGRNTQRVHTSVVMEDGQTLAIGGLIQNEVTANTTKFPVLGDLPFVGVFFSTKQYSETERELLILVTPRLVDPMACDQLPKYLPGQESRTPDDFELFLEGIMEAPRGHRAVFPDQRYKAAYLNGPTASLYPCAGGNCQGNGSSCGTGGSTGGLTHDASPGGVTAMEPRASSPKPMATFDLGGSNKPSGLSTVPPETAPAPMGDRTPRAAGTQGTALSAPDAPAKETKPFILPSVSEIPSKEGGK
jgi:pilus assembly protein CpaC